MPPDLPPGSRCKTEGCGATIHWTKTRLGKGVPLEPTPDPQGAWVVDQDPAMGPVASKYSPQAHGGMKRYRSHLERCHPKGKGPAAPAPKPDATAGLAFPRRAGQVGPFPPLDVLAPAEGARARADRFWELVGGSIKHAEASFSASQNSGWLPPGFGGRVDG